MAEPKPRPEVPCEFCGAPVPMDMCGPLLWVEVARTEPRYAPVCDACHRARAGKKPPTDVQDS